MIDKVDRFWSKVNVGSSNPEECWNWVGTTRNGYGRTYWNGKIDSVHRISWRLFHGEIPDGLFVCHHCDNRACVNPSHLFLGTFSDNMQDMWNKHRHPLPKGMPSELMRGELNNHAKLTKNEVLDIRTIASLGVSQHKIARWFHVDSPAIWKIVHRKTWVHV